MSGLPPEDSRNVVIVGAGAVGGCLAEQLARGEGNRVFFAAAGERLKRLSQTPPVVNGRSLEIEVLPFDRPAIEIDLIVLAVKAPQLTEAIEALKPLVGVNTTILSLLNGIDSESQIAAVYGWDRTLYGYVVQIDAIRSGNSIKSLSKGHFVFGKEKNNTLCDRVCLVKEIFERAGADCEVPADMIRQLWWKFMVNVGMNPPSAILRAPYGVFQECAEAHSLMVGSMNEVISVASAEGISLDGQDIAAWTSVLKSLDPDGKTSMLQDVEAGRATEVDIFCGAMSRLGRKHGIPTPLNNFMYKAIRAIEHSAQKKGVPA
jgi:2-dehydropantoate 2-reductase